MSDKSTKFFVWGSVLLGVLFLIASGVYAFTPAGLLPTLMPGFEANSTHIHYKHALGSFVVALGLFAYSWFNSAPKQLS